VVNDHHRPKDVSPVLASISQLFRTAPAATQTDQVEAEWQRLLAAASTPQERDEINDVFSRATAA
jgi:hypothetical protein